MFLYKGLIIPINQDSGMFPVSRIILNSFTYIGDRTGHDMLLYSLIISSVPRPLPFFRFLIQIMISVSVTLVLSASELKFGTPNSSRESSTSSCSVLFISLKNQTKYPTKCRNF